MRQVFADPQCLNPKMVMEPLWPPLVVWLWCLRHWYASCFFSIPKTAGKEQSFLQYFFFIKCFGLTVFKICSCKGCFLREYEPQTQEALSLPENELHNPGWMAETASPPDIKTMEYVSKANARYSAASTNQDSGKSSLKRLLMCIIFATLTWSENPAGVILEVLKEHASVR